MRTCTQGATDSSYVDTDSHTVHMVAARFKLPTTGSDVRSSIGVHMHLP